MIAGIGIDVTDIRRVVAAVERNEHFTKRILTDDEMTQLAQLSDKRRFEYISGVFRQRKHIPKPMVQVWGHRLDFMIYVLLTTKMVNHIFPNSHLTATHLYRFHIPMTLLLPKLF